MIAIACSFYYTDSATRNQLGLIAIGGVFFIGKEAQRSKARTGKD
jgi:hypothetical protein